MAAVIFDLDGTLIDSAPDIHAAVNRLLADEGLAPLPFAVVKGFIGAGAGVLIQRVIAATGLPEDAHARLFGRFLADYETAHDLTRPYPGVGAALRALAEAGHGLAICTNKPMAPTRTVLRHLGLQDHFAVVLGGDSLPQRKPDPAPLLATLAAMGGGPALFVGDSEIDAECAARAGLDFALFTEGYRKAPVTDVPHRAAFADFALLPGIAADLFALA